MVSDNEGAFRQASEVLLKNSTKPYAKKQLVKNRYRVEIPAIQGILDGGSLGETGGDSKERTNEDARKSQIQ